MSPVRVTGYRETMRSLDKLARELKGEIRDELRHVAEPVRADAERLTVAGISHIGPRWSEMRVGVTASSVYVAPKKRGTKVASRKRPNLAPLLMAELVQAADNNEDRVRDGLENMLDRLTRETGLQGGP